MPIDNATLVSELKAPRSEKEIYFGSQRSRCLTKAGVLKQALKLRLYLATRPAAELEEAGADAIGQILQIHQGQEVDGFELPVDGRWAAQPR